MNKESVDIIKNTVKPDRELIEKTKTVAMNKSRIKLHIPALIAACLLVILCAAFAVTKTQNGDFTGTVPVNETTEEESELLFSDILPYKNLTGERAYGNGLLSIAPFSEFYLKDCTAVIEGEILSVREKEYTVVYEFDKFEKGGLLTEKTGSLIYEIRVDKVWYGKINEGDILIIENELLGAVFTQAVGRRYVLPLCDEGEDIRLDEAGQRYLSGDIKRESRYSIIYPFHPQTERTDKGYIFTDEWESLITDETKPVILNIYLSKEEEAYADRMRFNTEEVFTEQFTALLNKVGLTP